MDIPEILDYLPPLGLPHDPTEGLFHLLRAEDVIKRTEYVLSARGAGSVVKLVEQTGRRTGYVNYPMLPRDRAAEPI